MQEVFEKILERLEADEKHTFDGCINKRYAKQIVQEVAEEYKDDWIPCSERLPEEELEKAKKERGSEAVFPVLATINKKHVVTGEKYTTVNRAFYGCYNDKNFYNSCCDKLDVIAWQPLPQPYQTKGEREA